MPQPSRRLNPRVSVIVPAFNAELTIRDAVASVFAQTYRDFEVIVVDDGSSDATCAALETWRDCLTYVRQPNGGPGRARNTGIERARGEFVAFLDADDLWLPRKLERQIEYFEAFPAAGLVHTAVFLGTPDAEPLARAEASVACTPPRQLFCELFETRTEIHTLSVMARRPVIDEVGGFDERREIHVEDWDLWLRIAERYPIGYVPAPLAVHHEGGVMSEGLDETYAGQMLVLRKAAAAYRARCSAMGRDAARGMRRPLHRIAWELGYARLQRNDASRARRAFREALHHRPLDLRTHLYHLGSCLPGRVIAALRGVKRRRRTPLHTGRVVPPPASVRDAVTREARLVHDTTYRRIRHAAAERLHQVDDAIAGCRDNRRRILFEAASPLSFVVFRPLYQRLSADPRLEFYFTSTSGSWPAATIFRSVGITDHVIPSGRASWMKFDACVNTDFYEMTWLHRCAVRLHMFHGVAGKYGIDSPVHVAPDIAQFNALLFPNLDRLGRYLDARLIDERAAMLVGFPKVDCLVDGSLDRDEIVTSLALDPDLPTILYAPTWSPNSSLHLVGEDVVRCLTGADFNVLVKLHDRSYDLTRRASGGIDWLSRFSSYAGHDRVRIIRDPDASRYLMAADALVTDHSSIGFEYALLDRPIVVIDAPELLRRARINPHKVAMLRAAAHVASDPAGVLRGLEWQLANPPARSAERRRLGDMLFYKAGTATDRAVGVVYRALGLDPLTAPAPAARSVGAPVAMAERKAS